MKPTIEYSEFVTEHGMDLEVKGEVFSEPIKRMTHSSEEFYTRVTVINVDTKVPVNAVYFKKENDEDTLKLLVNGIKNEPKYLKNESITG